MDKHEHEIGCAVRTIGEVLEELDRLRRIIEIQKRTISTHEEAEKTEKTATQLEKVASDQLRLDLKEALARIKELEHWIGSKM